MVTKSTLLILSSVFTEIKFSPSLLFSDLTLLTGYMNFLRKEFDSVNYDENTKRILCNSMEGKRQQADIANNRFVFDFSPGEDINSYKEFQGTVDLLLKEYLNKFDVNQFNRAGIRSTWIAEHELEVSKQLFNKCFLPVLLDAKHPLNVLTGLNSGKVELYFSLQEDARLNVAILPARIQNLIMKIDLTGQHYMQKTMEGIMFDIDFFIEGKVTVDRYLKHLDEAEKTTKVRANNILSVMMGVSHGS